MTTGPWHLHDHGVTYRTHGLAGTLQLDRPALGLFDLRIGGVDRSRGTLLGVRLPGAEPSAGDRLLGPYVHQDALTATYHASQAWPVRADVSWRALDGGRDGGALAALELWLSLHTELLDVRPQLAVESVLPAVDVALPCSGETDSEAPWRPAVLSPQGVALHRGCVLVRLAGGRWSYAEMVHPADYRRSELLPGETPQSLLTVRHHLFGESLEKGVIRRARIRGVLVPRWDDTRRAAQAYAAFLASEPPLGV